MYGCDVMREGGGGRRSAIIIRGVGILKVRAPQIDGVVLF